MAGLTEALTAKGPNLGVPGATIEGPVLSQKRSSPRVVSTGADSWSAKHTIAGILSEGRTGRFVANLRHSGRYKLSAVRSPNRTRIRQRPLGDISLTSHARARCRRSRRSASATRHIE
jgi:hypothetical protein